jgi:hypothetical protein
MISARKDNGIVSLWFLSIKYTAYTQSVSQTTSPYALLPYTHHISIVWQPTLARFATLQTFKRAIDRNYSESRHPHLFCRPPPGIWGRTIDKRSLCHSEKPRFINPHKSNW